MFISSRRRHDRRRAAGRVALALRRSSLVGVPCICCDECGAVEMDRVQSQVLALGEQMYTAPHRRAGSVTSINPRCDGHLGRSSGVARDRVLPV